MTESYRILLVAPDKEADQHLSKSIETASYSFTAATTCLAAMGQVKTSEIDVVLLRNGIEGFTVPDICRVLKSLMPGKFLPIIFVGDGEEHECTTLEQTGADDWITPPVQAAELSARVRALMRTKFLHDQLHESKQELEKSLARERSLLTQLREDNRELKVRSITDGLTSLYNYRYLMEWLKTEFKISRRYGHRLSMVLVDVDHFKQVNDSCGHMFGDYVLKEVAVVLKNETRESDFVARYAGDEFAIALPRTGRKEAYRLAGRVLKACTKHSFDHKGKQVPVTMSLGVATYPEDAEIVSPELLVYLADQALYHAKRGGRNAVCMWEQMEAKARLDICSQLQAPHRQDMLKKDPKRLAEAQMMLASKTGTFL